MDDDVFNLHLRQFLKKLGVRAQRDIERAVCEAAARGELDEKLAIRATVDLQCPELGVHLQLQDDIALR